MCPDVGSLSMREEYYAKYPERRPKPEDYIKVARYTGKLVYELLPLTWIPDMAESIKNAKTEGEMALYLGASALFLGFDVIDLYPAARAGTRAVRVVIKETIEQITNKMVKQGFEKEVAEKAAKRLVEAVVENKEVAEKALGIAGPFKSTDEMVQTAKGFFIPKDKSELYKALDGQMENSVEIVERMLFKDIKMVGKLEEGIEDIGIGIMDKGKTWFLNNLSKEFGDVGLVMYMKAAVSNADKFGVKLIATGADEIVVVSAKGGAENIKEFYKAVMKDVMKEVKEMENVVKDRKIFDMFKDALTSVSLHADTATLKVKDGKVLLASSHAPTNFHNLSTFLSMAESRELFNKVPEKYVQTLRNFTKISGEALQTLEKSDGVFVARLGFSEEATEAFLKVGDALGKGTGQALRENGVGPSLLNLLGHSTADYFSSRYAKAVKTAFEEMGHAVDVGQAGAPLSISYSLKGGKKLTSKELTEISRRAEQIFIDTVKREHPELGLNGVMTFVGESKEVAERMLFKHITHNILEGLDVDMVRSSIALLHTELKHSLNNELKEFLTDRFGKAFVSDVPDKVHTALQNIPKWVRQPEDLVTYLESKGISEEVIRSTIGFLSGVSI
ncbi:MAG: hypothetical protein ACP5H8_03055 [Candidatus Micrarchaeia archaeon]